MITRAKIILTIFLMLAFAIGAGARGRDLSFKPELKPGQENRYVITASVDTIVTPAGENGIARKVHKELSSTVLLRTTEASEHGVISQEAKIEAITSRTSVDGTDISSDASGLVGQRVVFLLDSSGKVLKSSYPQAAANAGLVELLFGMTSWFPDSEVSVGQDWGANLGFFSSPLMSDIAKGSRTVYKLTSANGDAAVIEGRITLAQSGSGVLTSTSGFTNVNVIAKGEGNTRFEYDMAANRIVGGSTETTLEGRLANIAPTREGEKMKPREGTVVEKAKFSVRLAR